MEEIINEKETILTPLLEEPTTSLETNETKQDTESESESIEMKLTLVLEEPSTPLESNEFKQATESVETIPEETSKILDSIDELTLIIIKNEGISSITLSKKELDIINYIIANNPSFLKNTNDEILQIIKDRKIDTRDIPQIIKLIKNLFAICNEEYNNNNNNNNTKDLSHTISLLIKYIFHNILNNNGLDSPELITSFDNLVDICIELLEFIPSLKKQNFFTNLFKCN